MPDFTIEKFDSSKKYLKVKYPSKKVISYFYDNNECEYKVEIIQREEEFMKLGILKSPVMDVETINMLNTFFSSDRADSIKLEDLVEKSETCMFGTGGGTGLKFCSSSVGVSYLIEEPHSDTNQLEREREECERQFERERDQLKREREECERQIERKKEQLERKRERREREREQYERQVERKRKQLERQAEHTTNQIRKEIRDLNDLNGEKINLSNKVYKKTTIGGYEYYGEDGYFVIIKHLDKPSKYIEKVFSYKPGSEINYKTSFMNDQGSVGTQGKITINGLDNVDNVFCTEQINTIAEPNSPEFRALRKLVRGEKLTVEDIDPMSFWSGLNSS
ncbi:hypothetical protein OAG24_00700 [bacterium]|nr:hypothetical protein [bacterium]